MRFVRFEIAQSKFVFINPERVFMLSESNSDGGKTLIGTSSSDYFLVNGTLDEVVMALCRK